MKTQRSAPKNQKESRVRSLVLRRPALRCRHLCWTLLVAIVSLWMFEAKSLAQQPPRSVVIDGQRYDNIERVEIKSNGIVIIRQQWGGLVFTSDKVPLEFLEAWRLWNVRNSPPPPPRDPPQQPPRQNVLAPHMDVNPRWQPGQFTPLGAIFVQGRQNPRPGNAADFSFAIEVKNMGRQRFENVVVRAQAYKRGRGGRVFPVYLFPLISDPFTSGPGRSQWIIARAWQDHGEDYIGYIVEIRVGGQLFLRKSFPNPPPEGFIFW